MKYEVYEVAHIRLYKHKDNICNEDKHYLLTCRALGGVRGKTKFINLVSSRRLSFRDLKLTGCEQIQNKAVRYH